MPTRIARSSAPSSGRSIPVACDQTSLESLLTGLHRASYRDLLGTAERIIEMDHQIQDVDATLGVIGRKCNSRRVDKIAQNYSGLLEHRRKMGTILTLEDESRLISCRWGALLVCCATTSPAELSHSHSPSVEEGFCPARCQSSGCITSPAQQPFKVRRRTAFPGQLEDPVGLAPTQAPQQC